MSDGSRGGKRGRGRRGGHGAPPRNRGPSVVAETQQAPTVSLAQDDGKGGAAVAASHRGGFRGRGGSRGRRGRMANRDSQGAAPGGDYQNLLRQPDPATASSVSSDSANANPSPDAVAAELANAVASGNRKDILPDIMSALFGGDPLAPQHNAGQAGPMASAMQQSMNRPSAPLFPMSAFGGQQGPPRRDDVILAQGGFNSLPMASQGPFGQPPLGHFPGFGGDMGDGLGSRSSGSLGGLGLADTGYSQQGVPIGVPGLQGLQGAPPAGLAGLRSLGDGDDAVVSGPVRTGDRKSHAAPIASATGSAAASVLSQQSNPPRAYLDGSRAPPGLTAQMGDMTLGHNGHARPVSAQHVGQPHGPMVMNPFGFGLGAGMPPGGTQGQSHVADMNALLRIQQQQQQYQQEQERRLQATLMQQQQQLRLQYERQQHQHQHPLPHQHQHQHPHPHQFQNQNQNQQQSQHQQQQHQQQPHRPPVVNLQHDPLSLGLDTKEIAVTVAQPPVSDPRAPATIYASPGCAPDTEASNKKKGGKPHKKPRVPTQGMLLTLHNHLMQVLAEQVPSDDTYMDREKLRLRVEAFVQKAFPSARLAVFGSTVTRLCTTMGDMDLTLLMEDDDPEKPLEYSEIVEKMAERLEEGKFLDVKALPKARVPIVKFKDPALGLAMDMGINNRLALRNSELLRDYARVDSRLRPLCYLIKYWARRRKINDPYRGTLSSYAYVLMVVNFLQQRNPPILPVLQNGAGKGSQTLVIQDFECWYEPNIARYEGFGSANHETLAQLMVAFMQLWAHDFDFHNTVVSVRCGSYLTKKSKEWTESKGRDRHWVSIEDPFETSHDLGRVCDKTALHEIRGEFMRAHRILCESGDLVKMCEPYTEEWRGS